MSFISQAKEGGAGVIEKVGDGVSAASNGLTNSFTAAGETFSSVTSIDVSEAYADLASGEVGVRATLEVPGYPNGSVSINIKYTAVPNGSFSGSTLTVAGKTVPFDPENLDAVIDYAMEHSLDWIPNFGIVERVCENDYREIFARLEQIYGDGNVYIASKEFVDWCCPTTIGRGIAKIIVTAGAAAETIADGAKARAKREFGLIKKWLEKKAQATFDVANVVDKLLNGVNPTTLVPELSLRWQNVEYSTHIRLLGDDVGATNFSETHWGFVIIWIDAGTPINFTPLSHNPGEMEEVDLDESPATAKWRLGIKPQYTTLGCLVIFVAPGSAAKNAGILVGETITAIDGKPVGNINGAHWVFWRVLETSSTGTVDLTVIDHDGAARTVTCTLTPNQ